MIISDLSCLIPFVHDGETYYKCGVENHGHFHQVPGNQKYFEMDRTLWCKTRGARPVELDKKLCDPSACRARGGSQPQPSSGRPAPYREEVGACVKEGGEAPRTGTTWLFDGPMDEFIGSLGSPSPDWVARESKYCRERCQHQHIYPRCTGNISFYCYNQCIFSETQQ